MLHLLIKVKCYEDKKVIKDCIRDSRVLEKNIY